MHPDDVKALGALAGTAMAATTSGVEQLHKAILQRALTGAGRTVPVAAVHDGIAHPIYRSVRGLTGALGRAAGLALAQAREPAGPRLADSRGGSLALGALNGLWGDRLAHDGGPLAPDMGLRLHGADVPAAASALREAYPDATGRVAVFVHGWCETDTAWKLFGRRRPTRPGPPSAPTAPACGTISASRRCGSATTPACTSPTTAAASPRCSTR